MAQSKKTKSIISSADKSKSFEGVTHEKIKNHVQKFRSHVKKHHKKYLGGFFAGFAIAKTAKVMATALGLIAGSFFITSHTPLHEVEGKEVDYGSCVFEQQFCFDLAANYKWGEAQIEDCIKNGEDIVIAYNNNEIDNEKFLVWLKGLGLDSIDEFFKSYDTYTSFICECCVEGELGKGCCDAKYDNCVKVADGKYKDYCTNLKNLCEGEECKSQQQEQKCDEKLLPENAKPTVEIFYQYLKEGVWVPEKMEWTYEGDECGFICVDDYTRNKEKEACEKVEQQEQKCDEKLLPENAKPTVEIFYQYLKEGVWVPENMEWTYDGNECGFICVDDYTWNKEKGICEKEDYDGYHGQLKSMHSKGPGGSGGGACCPETMSIVCSEIGGSYDLDNCSCNLDIDCTTLMLMQMEANFVAGNIGGAYTPWYEVVRGGCKQSEISISQCELTEERCLEIGMGFSEDTCSCGITGQNINHCTDANTISGCINMGVGGNTHYIENGNGLCACVYEYSENNGFTNGANCGDLMFSMMTYNALNLGWSYTPWLVFNDGSCEKSCDCEECGLTKEICNTMGMSFDSESCSCGISGEGLGKADVCELIQDKCELLTGTHYINNGNGLCACVYECIGDSFDHDYFWETAKDEDIINLVYEYMACDRPKSTCPSLRVVHTNTLSSLSANTVYVLDNVEEIQLASSLDMPDCTAILSSQIHGKDTTLYLKNSEAYTIDMAGNCTVLDNISVKGPNKTAGIYVHSGDGKTLNVVKVYNSNYGIIVEGTDLQNVILNNIQAYNNGSAGIYFLNTDKNPIYLNNAQSYKNSVGINLNSVVSVKVNNSIIYGNSIGLKIQGISNNNIFNDVKIYRNGSDNRIQQDNTAGPNYYYGTLGLMHYYDNQSCGSSTYTNGTQCNCELGLRGECRPEGSPYTIDECGEICSDYNGPKHNWSGSCPITVTQGACTQILITGNDSFFDTGSISLSGNPNNDYYTNPFDINDNYLYTRGTWNTNNIDFVVKYSYGERIPTQKMPLLGGSAQLPLGTDIRNYIGSNVQSFAGQFGLSLTRNSKVMYSGIGTAISTAIIDVYSIFGLAQTGADGSGNNQLEGKFLNINSVSLHLVEGWNRFVMQVFSKLGIYFATHKYYEIPVKRPAIRFSTGECVSVSTFVVTGTWEPDTVYQRMNGFTSSDLSGNNGLTIVNNSFHEDANSNDNYKYHWTVTFDGMIGGFNIFSNTSEDNAHIGNAANSRSFLNMSKWHPTTSIISALNTRTKGDSSGDVYILFNTNKNKCGDPNKTWICDYESGSALCDLCNDINGNDAACNSGVNNIMRYKVHCDDGYVCLKKLRYNSHSNSRDGHKIWEVDVSGNWPHGTGLEAGLVKIDRAAPVITYIGNDPYSTGVVMNIKIDDDSQYTTGAGVSGFSYKIVTSSAVCENQSFSSMFSVNAASYETGINITNSSNIGKYVCIKAIDNVGNISYQKIGPIKRISCLNNWDNDYFLTGRFWDLYDADPKNDYIICALYGSSKNDETAYTKYWDGWTRGDISSGCNVIDMVVEKTGTLLTDTLNYNTIYVVTGGDVSRLTVNMGNCTAVVSKKKGGTTFQGTSTQNISGMFYFTGNSYSILDNLNVKGGDHDDYFGVNIYGGGRNTLNNLHIYNYTHWAGLSLISQTEYNLVNNIVVQNSDHGIGILGYHNIVNNYYGFNNTLGLRLIGQYNTINNSQTHNNSTYGIGLYGSNNALNNVSSYNNSTHGFDISQPNNKLHNVGSYNNGGYGINSSTTVYSYGDIKLFSNQSGDYNTIPSFGSIPSLGWTQGTISTGAISWNYITNPVSDSSSYLIPWYKHLYLHTFRGTNTSFGYASGYSYGINIPTQIMPVYYSGTELTGMTDKYYDAENYIGSVVRKINGSGSISHTFVQPQEVYHNVASVSLASTKYSIDTVKLAWGPGINDVYDCIGNYSSRVTGYSALPSITNRYRWFNLNKPGFSSSSGTVSIGSISSVSTYTCGNDDDIAIQLWGTNGYFATHFQGENNICTTPPDIPGLYYPNNGFTGASTTINFEWLVPNVQCGTISGYQILICDDSNCNTILRTGNVVSNTYPTGGFMQLHRYYWKVRAQDTYGNWGDRTNPWTFYIDRPLDCGTWENDNFLTGGFWSTDPSDGKIICALYGTGENDTTAYTVGWRGWQWGRSCDVEHMAVERVSGLPSSLSLNTIYVLDVGSTILPSYRKMGDCTAIVSKSGTILYTNDYISTSMIEMKGQFSILDNLSIDGINYRVGFTHPTNDIGIKIIDSNNTFNNIRSYNNNQGIVLGVDGDQKMNIVGNNIQTYNNKGCGISLISLINGTLNNLQSFNNGSGVYLYKGGINILNNIQVYNNNNHGLQIYASTDNYFNNVKIFNNKGKGIYTDVLAGTGYGNIEIFLNGLGDELNGLNFGGPEYVLSLGWSKMLPSTGKIDWDIIMNVKDVNKYMLDWTGNYTSLRGVKTLGMVEDYSYGSGIKTQIRPVVWVGGNMNAISSLNSNQYIGGETRKSVGTADRLSCVLNAFTNIATCNYVSDWQPYTYNFVDNYRVYVLDAVSMSDIQPRLAQATASGVGINNMNYVTQLMGPSMEFTHFELDGVNPYLTGFIWNGLSCIKGGVPYTMTGIFSEIMSGFSVSSLITNNVSLSNFSSNNNPIFVWTVTSTGTSYGTSFIVIDTGAATDMAGNPVDRTGITWEYDSAGPTFEPSVLPVGECSTGTIYISITTNSGCANLHNTPYSFDDGNNWMGVSQYSMYSGHSGTQVVNMRVRDALDNYTIGNASFTWTDTKPHFIQTGLTYNTTISGTTLLYPDLIASMGPRDGACGVATMSTGNISCTVGGASWVGNGIQVTPPDTGSGDVDCSVLFHDDEGNVITGHVYYNYQMDNEPPVVTLSITTGEAQTSQTVTLKCSDGVGVTAYYRGTTEPTAATSISTTASLSSLTSSAGLSQTVSSAGTWWLACKDAEGNWSKTGIVVRSYSVQNLLDTLTGSATTYTKTNYAKDGGLQGTYYIPDGVTLTLDSGGIYGDPIEGHDIYKGWKTTYNTTNTTPTSGNPSITGNVTYYRWYTRDTHSLKLNKGTGISSVINSGTDTTNAISYKHGAVISISAIRYSASGYEFSGWTVDQGNTPASTTSASTTVTLTGDTILSAVARDGTAPVCGWGTPYPICISGGMAGTISLTCTDGVGISQTSVSVNDVQYDTSILTLGNSNTVAGTSTSKTYIFTYTGTTTSGTTGFTLRADAVKDTSNNGNVSTGPSNTVEVDNAGPTFVVSDVTVSECTTGTATITGVSQVGCASAASSQYSWNGGSSYTNSSTHDEYSAGTGIRDVTIRVRDSLGNYTETGIKYRWTDQVLQINSTYDLGLITGAITISNLTSSDVFNATGYGSCETVSVTSVSCVNATKVLNGNQLTITPTANFQGTGSCIVSFTDGDTIQTGVINFAIQTLKPTISWSGATSSINPGSCDSNNKLTRNRFLAKMKIGNTPELGTFTYSISDGSTTNTKTLYDDSLVLMYNFDKVTSLGESATVVKDLSNNGNTGTISSTSTVTWISNGVWGGAYYFAGGNINAGNDNSLRATNNFTVSVWIKTTMTTSSSDRYYVSRWASDKRVWGLIFPSGRTTAGVIYSTNGSNASYIYGSHSINDGNWHLITLTHDGSKLKLYVDGNMEGSGNNTSLYNTDTNFVISNTSSFNGQLDELRMYNRALTQDEIQFLYRSNLSKINTGEWFFQVLNTCLDTDKTYRYTGQVTSLYGYSTGINRSTCTNIPGVSITGGTDVNFGTFDVTGNIQTGTTEYTANVQVTDWRGKNGWTGSVKISPYFLGQQNPELKLSSENFTIKTNSLTDLGHFLTGIIPEYTMGVRLNTSLNQYTGIVISGANAFNGTSYFVTNYPVGDFMCNGGIYGDMPKMQLSIPAWTPGDTYVANVYWSIEPE